MILVEQNRSQTVHSEHLFKWRLDWYKEDGVETVINGLNCSQALHLKAAMTQVRNAVPGASEQDVIKFVLDNIPLI